jgi:hypothetical protein
MCKRCGWCESCIDGVYYSYKTKDDKFVFLLDNWSFNGPCSSYKVEILGITRWTLVHDGDFKKIVITISE